MDTFRDLWTYQWMYPLICQWCIIDISMQSSIDIPMVTSMDKFQNIYTPQCTCPLRYQWTHSRIYAYISAYIHCVVIGYTHWYINEYINGYVHRCEVISVDIGIDFFPFLSLSLYISIDTFFDIPVDMSFWYQCTYLLRD
jgi:hypothetical protein